MNLCTNCSDTIEGDGMLDGTMCERCGIEWWESECETCGKIRESECEC